MNRYTLAFLALGVAAIPALAADYYTIDPEFSQARFEVVRLAFSSASGRFEKTEGKVKLDFPARTGGVEFTVHTASLDMGSAAWTAHLLDEELFNAKRYPTMSYKSERLIFDGNKVVAAEGEFTMLGVTKPLRLDVKGFKCGISPIDKRQLCSGNVSAILKRSEFGLTKYIPAVSDEIAINVAVDAYKNQR